MKILSIVEHLARRFECFLTGTLTFMEPIHFIITEELKCQIT